MTTAILILMIVISDSNAIIPNEIEMLDDPNTLSLLFDEHVEVFDEPYWYRIAGGWLKDTEPRPYFKGILYEVGKPPTWTEGIEPYYFPGDVNHDGKVNMLDFGIAAANHKGGEYLPSPRKPRKQRPEPETMPLFEMITRTIKELM